MRLKFLFPVYTFLSIVLFSCKHEKPSEKEQYEDMRSSFKYKTYKTLSKGSISFIADNYNKQVDSAKDKVDDTFFRLMLGYYWSVTGHSSFAFAEADILAEGEETEDIKFLASMLNSCTMYEEGWTTLAKEESDKGMERMSAAPDKELLETEVMVFHLLVGSVCVQQEHYDAAKFHFAGFAQLTGITFPYKLIDVMIDVKKGDLQAGLKKARILSEDPAIPGIIRTELKAIIVQAEEKGGDVNSSLFWPKIAGSFIVDELKSSSQKGISSLMGSLAMAVDKLK